MEMRKWTAKQYADWVYPYSHSGFWQKVKFETWKKRLFLMGWTEEFWDHYKELRADDGSESYSDYMNRKGREDAEEHTRNG